MTSHAFAVKALFAYPGCRIYCRYTATAKPDVPSQLLSKSLELPNQITGEAEGAITPSSGNSRSRGFALFSNNKQFS